MNNFNQGILPLNYLISSFSTQESEFPVYNIKNGNSINNKGWSSVRYCSYPQFIIIQFFSFCNVKQINFLINHERIPSKIDICSFSPQSFSEMTVKNNNFHSIRFDYCGSIVPKHHETHQRELLKIPFGQNNNYAINNCLYLKFIFRENYSDLLHNQFNQVGIVGLECFGYYVNINLKMELFSKNETLFLDKLHEDDEYVEQIRKKLYFAKKRYYTNENDRGIYEDIEKLRYFGNIIKGLEEAKLKNNIRNDYSSDEQINGFIIEILQHVEDRYRIYDKEVIIYENTNCEDYLKKYGNKLYYYDEELIKKEMKNKIEKEVEQIKSQSPQITLNTKMDPKSKEIVERRLRKKALIEKSKEEAKHNLKLESLTTKLPNINL